MIFMGRRERSVAVELVSGQGTVYRDTRELLDLTVPSLVSESRKTPPGAVPDRHAELPRHPFAATPPLMRGPRLATGYSHRYARRRQDQTRTGAYRVATSTARSAR